MPHEFAVEVASQVAGEVLELGADAAQQRLHRRWGRSGGAIALGLVTMLTLGGLLAWFAFAS